MSAPSATVTLKTLEEKHEIQHIRIIPGSKINKKVKQILHSLGSPAATTGPVNNTARDIAGEGKLGTDEQQEKERDGLTTKEEDKPRLVLLTAESCIASKLITVVEIVKRVACTGAQRLSGSTVTKEENRDKSGQKTNAIYQYNYLYGQELEKKPKAVQNGETGKKKYLGEDKSQNNKRDHEDSQDEAPDTKKKKLKPRSDVEFDPQNGFIMNEDNQILPNENVDTDSGVMPDHPFALSKSKDTSVSQPNSQFQTQAEDDAKQEAAYFEPLPSYQTRKKLAEMIPELDDGTSGPKTKEVPFLTVCLSRQRLSEVPQGWIEQMIP